MSSTELDLLAWSGAVLAAVALTVTAVLVLSKRARALLPHSARGAKELPLFRLMLLCQGAAAATMAVMVSTFTAALLTGHIGERPAEGSMSPSTASLVETASWATPSAMAAIAAVLAAGLLLQSASEKRSRSGKDHEPEEAR